MVRLDDAPRISCCNTMCTFFIILLVCLDNLFHASNAFGGLDQSDHSRFSGVCGTEQHFPSLKREVLGKQRWTTPSALCSYYRAHKNSTIVSRGFSCENCPQGSFWCVLTMRCRKILDCAEIQILIDTPVGQSHSAEGGVKRIFHRSWGPIDVAVASGKSHVREDFFSGVHTLKELSSTMSPFVVPLIGFCPDRLEMVVPWYPMGAAHNFDAVLRKEMRDIYGAQDYHTSAAAQEMIFSLRLQAVEDYLTILAALHGYGTRATPRVLCDCKEGPVKLLSQFLVTNTLRLVLNDVDAAPAVSPACRIKSTGRPGVKCGHRQFSGSDFVAPEQLWPWADRAFADDDMPCYDEKVDVYKIPETIQYLLGSEFLASLSPASRIVFQRLFDGMVQDCKMHNPAARPSAYQVLANFSSVTRHLQINRQPS
eukprot:m.128722 g.128722  ORF g.128722 m.128722 type:complete len:424 (-) comp17441_c0_seq1:572-1843(-)